jgi:hypothetical protein
MPKIEERFPRKNSFKAPIYWNQTSPSSGNNLPHAEKYIGNILPGGKEKRFPFSLRIQYSSHNILQLRNRLNGSRPKRALEDGLLTRR